ncbi:hypothetical protein E2562_013448 [Oryza meyeriana var. granulata]|uniref:BTB domain-containing protein n=1 Tax=Oryza meyeriana var. granulata TaxID=110450 RepID=A0A6G1BW07_9ORYZ|nr:hypothetical protein E2562_013448 [Oryza meyeriana var. granulata]
MFQNTYIWGPRRPRRRLPAAAAPSQCSGSAAAVVRSSGHHVFEIHDYSLVKAITPKGNRLRSGSFAVGGHSWHLEYFPNGYSPDLADYVCVALALEDDAVEPVNAQFNIHFVGARYHLQVMHQSDAKKVYAFSRQLPRWGQAMIIKREKLESIRGIIVDDRFAIRCDIVVVGMITDAAAAATSFVDVPPPTDLGPHLHAFLTSRQSSKVGADVTFQVGEQRFTAHRFVLAARSPVFMAELYGPMAESDTKRIIEIEDMEPEVFSALLSFMYTDSLLMTEKDNEVAMTQHLLVAVDRYDLKRLRLICEDKLCKNIDDSNVTNMLAFVDQRPSCQGLKKACLEFLVKLPPETLDKVIATKAFDHLAVNCSGVVKDLLSKLAARG